MQIESYENSDQTSEREQKNNPASQRARERKRLKKEEEDRGAE